MKETLLCCRITAQEKGLYRLCHDGVEQAAQVSGKFQYEALGPSDYPTVGDEVLADLNGGGQAVIHKVLPRKSLFLRKAAGTAREEQPVAANVDILFLCMALNNDFNLRRLERYLAAAWNSGATPVVVLTKADLCGNPSEKVAAVEEAAPGTDVLLTSAAQEDGIRPLLPYLTPGRTVAFVGSSGVGKSTLMNGLLGKEILATGGLRNDDRGRHTTTRRQMFFLPGGADRHARDAGTGPMGFGVWAGNGLRRYRSTGPAVPFSGLPSRKGTRLCCSGGAGVGRIVGGTFSVMAAAFC